MKETAKEHIDHWQAYYLYDQQLMDHFDHMSIFHERHLQFRLHKHYCLHHCIENMHNHFVLVSMSMKHIVHFDRKLLHNRHIQYLGLVVSHYLINEYDQLVQITVR